MEDKPISQKGLILYFGTDNLYFIPTKEFDNRFCLDLYETSNLETGFEFTVGSYEYLKRIRSVARPYRVENVDEKFDQKFDTVNIARVEITYKVILDRTKELVLTQPHLNLKINDKIRGFDYNLADINTLDLVVFDCK